jgi:phosphoserine aminotransferase
MGSRNKAKAELLYSTIDSLPMFEAPVSTADRSEMNAVFFMKDASREEDFLTYCKQEGMIGVKGYRTVGGIRISMYNALPHSSVQSFCELLQYYAQKNG